MLRCTAIETTDFRWTSPFHPPSEVDDPAGFSAEAQTRSLPAGALANCIVKRRCGPSPLPRRTQVLTGLPLQP